MMTSERKRQTDDTSLRENPSVNLAKLQSFLIEVVLIKRMNGQKGFSAAVLLKDSNPSVCVAVCSELTRATDSRRTTVCLCQHVYFCVGEDYDKDC